MNQQLVYINREDDIIIVQDKGKTDVYQDTLENFAIDHGEAVPSYINKLELCIDTGLRLLNGGRIDSGLDESEVIVPEHWDEAMAYAESLIPLAGSLFETQDARRNPPKPEPEEPVLSEEEKQKQELEEAIMEAKDYLRDTDYAVIKCTELGLDLETEYPGLKAKRQAARDKVNASEAQVQVLTASIAEASNV